MLIFREFCHLVNFAILVNYVNFMILLNFVIFQGLRGIYVASQIVNTNEDSRMIEPKNLQTKISFDQGAVWIPIKGPKTDEEGRDFTDCLDADYRCNLHLSQQVIF